MPNLFGCLRKRNFKSKEKLEIETMLGMSIVKSLQYDFHTIKVATDNFSAKNRLGGCGFGNVYKGVLPDGHIVAVKRYRESKVTVTEFKNEVLLSANVEYPNIVRLLGFCLEGAEKFLIYEFAVNGSLDHFIFDKTNGADFDWEKRHKVIGQIAQGLLYLHEDSRIRIIHRDLHPRHILLDEDMNAKIKSFSLAMSFTPDESEVYPEILAGTVGYIAPEYITHGYVSPKTDVYSFGVLVLEIVSGERVMSRTIQDEENAQSLVHYAWKMWCEGMVSNLIDTNLLQSSSTEEIMRCIHIGLLCVQENDSDRPTMSSVVDMLSTTSITLAEPSTAAFY